MGIIHTEIMEIMVDHARPIDPKTCGYLDFKIDEGLCPNIFSTNKPNGLSSFSLPQTSWKWKQIAN